MIFWIVCAKNVFLFNFLASEKRVRLFLSLSRSNDYSEVNSMLIKSWCQLALGYNKTYEDECVISSIKLNDTKI